MIDSNKNKHIQPERDTIERSMDEFINYGKFKVKLYIRHLERQYCMDITDIILNICCTYFGKELDYFDKNNKGLWCTLNDSQTVCTLIGDAANTIYGSIKIK